VVNDGEGLDSWEARRDRNLAKHTNGNGMGTPLTITTLQWATPTSHERTHSPRQVASGIQLANQVAEFGLQDRPTETAGDDGSSKAVLSPSFVEALMGLPPSWTVPTVSAVSATEWSRWWRRMRSELLRLA